MSVLERYLIILNMRDTTLIALIGMYNRNELSPKTRLALEIIDGCDGPGDRIVESGYHILPEAA